MSEMQLIELPDIVLETILSNLTFDEISRNRIICKRFDRIGKVLLNRGFNAIEKFHARCTKKVKSQLPRRESERRCHPLSRHNDILAAIETRISMLSMTFTKYIDLNLCCFIPGKVIDEIFRLLRVIRVMKTPPRAHEILQELRDLSSMAMEHFDEKILPDLKQRYCSSLVSNLGYELPSSSFTISRHHPPTLSLASSLASSPTTSNLYSDKSNHPFKDCFNRTVAATTKMEIKSLKQLVKKQNGVIQSQNKKINQLNKKMKNLDSQVVDLKKYLEEWEQKIGDLTTKVNRAQDETDNIDTHHKRKGLELKNLQAKKRKLIIERQVSHDPKDAKFKKFMSNLLSGDSKEGESSC